MFSSRWSALAGVALCASLLPSAALGADTQLSQVDRVEDRAWDWSLGTRIGGYGFRHAGEERLEWSDCRMNGVGAFAQATRFDALYLQVSLDGYYATQHTIDAGMDRMSLLAAGTVGARYENSTPVWPHVELGVGGEVTQVELGGAQDTRVLPMAFVGVGAELAFGRLRFGTTLRVMGTALPQHGHTLEVKHEGAGSGEATAVEAVFFEAEIAGQATFSLRYVF